MFINYVKNSRVWLKYSEFKFDRSHSKVEATYGSVTKPTDIDLYEFCKITDDVRCESLLWVGTDFNQDNSGTLQAMKSKCDHFTYFTQENGEYGLNRPGYNSAEPYIAENSRRLLTIFEELKSQGKKPSVLVGQMLGCNISSDVLDTLKGQGCFIVNIAMDDKLPIHWKRNGAGLRVGAIELARSTNLTLTTDMDSVGRYRKENCPAKFFPLASSADNYIPGTEKVVDICFVGNKYGYRGRLVSQLLSAGINVELRGRGWPKGSANTKEMFELFSSARIILGIGYISYSTKFTTQKLRDFDALMNGACYITSFNSEVAQYFEDGKEILFYRSMDELKMLIQQCIDDPKRAVEIGKRAREKCLKYHTWNIRVGAIIQASIVDKEQKNLSTFENMSNSLLSR